jgi:transcriptional regulator with XRE-family HTH domain
MPQIELAERLGIKKQNITLWIKGRQPISKKYLPILEELFHLPSEYFNRELTEIEQLEIQKDKLKKELNPIIQRYESKLTQGAERLEKHPVYNREEINAIERSLEKAKLIERFKASLEIIDNHPFMDSYRIIVELFEKAGDEVVLHKTLQGLAHYLNVLPGDITTGGEQEEFESALFEVLEDNNY